MGLRTFRAIDREYKIVQRLLHQPLSNDYDRAFLDGARQALAWALDDNAMRPARCVKADEPTKGAGKGRAG